MASARDRVGQPCPPFKQRSLVRALGWEQNKRKDIRPYRSVLAEATVRFRRDFCPAFGEFPLDHKHPRVKECARLFCERELSKDKDRFFEKTSETSDPEALTLPEDQAQIEDLLAKLFCLQEDRARHNFYVKQIAEEQGKYNPFGDFIDEDNDHNYIENAYDNISIDDDDDDLYNGPNDTSNPKGYSLRPQRRRTWLEQNLNNKTLGIAENQHQPTLGESRDDSCFSDNIFSSSASSTRESTTIERQSGTQRDNHMNDGVLLEDKSVIKDGRYYKDPARVVEAWPNGKLTSLDEIRETGAMTPFYNNGGTSVSYWKANMMLMMGCGTSAAGTCERCSDDQLPCTYSIDPHDREGRRPKKMGLMRTQYCARCLFSGIRCVKLDPSHRNPSTINVFRDSDNGKRSAKRSTTLAAGRATSYVPKAKSAIGITNNDSGNSKTRSTPRPLPTKINQEIPQDSIIKAKPQTRSVDAETNTSKLDQLHQSKVSPNQRGMTTPQDSTADEANVQIQREITDKDKSSADTSDGFIRSHAVADEDGLLHDDSSSLAAQRRSLNASLESGWQQEKASSILPNVDEMTIEQNSATQSTQRRGDAEIRSEFEGTASSIFTRPPPPTTNSWRRTSSADIGTYEAPIAKPIVQTTNTLNDDSNLVKTAYGPLTMGNMTSVDPITEVKDQPRTTDQAYTSNASHYVKPCSLPADGDTDHTPDPALYDPMSPPEVVSAKREARKSSTQQPEVQHPTSQFTFKRPRSPDSTISPDSPVPTRRRIELNPRKITFIVPNTNHQLQFHTDRPFPSRCFKGANTVMDFLNIFCSHTGIDLSFIEKLTFTVAFANDERLEVRRMAGMEEWKTLQQRLSSLYRIQRARRPDQFSFEVYVEVGESMANGKTVEDDDLDGF